MRLENSRIPYAGAFYVAIFPDDYAAFPEPPATYLAGRCIVVQGTIETYRGAPQIVLRHADDLRIVEAPPGTAPRPADADDADDADDAGGAQAPAAAATRGAAPADGRPAPASARPSPPR